MPASDSPTALVARFLKDNGYERTLAAFLEETNLSAEALTSDASASTLTIESVLDEKRLYDLSLKVSKTTLSLPLATPSFTEPYPSIPTTLDGFTPANILFTAISHLSAFPRPVIIATAADRSLHLFSALPPFSHLRTFRSSDSPILCVAVLSEQYLLTSSMTGTLTLLDPSAGDVLSSTKPHEKYATRVLIHTPPDSPDPIAISSAYDKSIVLTPIRVPSSGGVPEFSPSVYARLTTESPPEALCILPGKNVLIYSRRDSTCLFYHLLEPSLPLIRTQDLAESGASWAAYHAMSIVMHPEDKGLVAVATSSVPHMKLFVLDIGEGGNAQGDEKVMEVFTGAEQSAYSTAAVSWRPDRSGVWVNADDGVVRGVEMGTGKVRARLEVCSGGEKVRALWGGKVEGVGEVLVTGGFDKKLTVWTAGDVSVDAA